MVHKSPPSSAADLLSLAIRTVNVMSSASILQVRVCALRLTLPSNDTRIGELESQIASKN